MNANTVFVIALAIWAVLVATGLLAFAHHVNSEVQS